MSGINVRGLVLVHLLTAALVGCGSSNSSGSGGNASTQGSNSNGSQSTNSTSSNMGQGGSNTGTSMSSAGGEVASSTGGFGTGGTSSSIGGGGSSSTTNTGTAAGTGGSMAMGACTDAADEAATSNMMTVSNAANTCGENCFTNTSQCAPCMKMALGLTTACSVCWGNVIACGASKCLSQCISNPNSAACMNCNNQKCEPAFHMCSGT